MRLVLKVRDPTRVLRDLLGLGFSLREGPCFERDLDGSTPAAALDLALEQVSQLLGRGVEVTEVRLQWAVQAGPQQEG